MLEEGADPVRKISIIPRGRSLGVTLATPDTDRYGYDENYLKGRIVGALGGMAAEELVFGVVTTGAESDLQTSTHLARMMVGRWGMSARIGPVQVLPEDGDPRTAGVSDLVFAAVAVAALAGAWGVHRWRSRAARRAGDDSHEASVTPLPAGEDDAS